MDSAVTAGCDRAGHTDVSSTVNDFGGGPASRRVVQVVEIVLPALTDVQSVRGVDREVAGTATEQLRCPPSPAVGGVGQSGGSPTHDLTTRAALRRTLPDPAVPGPRTSQH